MTSKKKPAPKKPSTKKASSKKPTTKKPMVPPPPTPLDPVAPAKAGHAAHIGRKERLLITMSREERDAIEANAKAAGLSLAHFLRVRGMA